MPRLEITVLEALKNILSFIEEEIEQDDQELREYFSGETDSEVITDTKVVRSFLENATGFFTGSETVIIDDKGNTVSVFI